MGQKGNCVVENTQNETGAVETKQPEAADTSIFTVGSVLSLTLKMLCKNPIVFFGLASLYLVLRMIAGLGLRALLLGISEELFEILQIYIHTLLAYWFSGAFAYAVFQTLKGNSVLLGASLSHGMKRFVPLIGAGTIYGLIISLIHLLRIFAGSEARYLIAPISIYSVILLCSWEVAASACVIERLGPAKSISRSYKLTDGCRMKIFVLILIVGIVKPAATRTVVLFMPPVEPIMLHSYLFLTALIPYAFGFVMSAVIYFELRKFKEGVTVDSLAKIDECRAIAERIENSLKF